MNTFQFFCVGLIGKFAERGEESKQLLLQIEQSIRSLGIDTWIEDVTEFAAFQGNKASRPQMAERCDLIIVVGGDGTLLSVARSFIHSDIPLLGINLGRLGFLVDLAPDNVDQALLEILSGSFKEDHRSLLEGLILDGADQGPVIALNDLVIHQKNEIARMIELDVYVDQAFLTSYHADGLIMATPTGSTAYALSTGGPIMHPSLAASLISPICPHTLTQRPLVLPANSVIEIKIPSKMNNLMLSADGQVIYPIAAGGRLLVQTCARRLRILHPLDYDYFKKLRSKLHWGGSLF